ncbi:Asp23/Gls24 family envelope stress response protein [Caldicellulosiruptoraceae bacterium PP1]
MSAFYETELGKIEISNECIAKIIGISSMENYGVVGMASKSMTDGIVNLLGMENLQRGIKVTSNEGFINADIHIVVEYGTRIPVIAENIKERVTFAIEKLTGLKAGQINVFIDGIRIN